MDDKFKLAVCILLVGVFLTACGSPSTPNSLQVTIEPTAVEPSLPKLSNGVDSWYWQLTAVELVESYSDSQGTYRALPDKLLLRVELEDVGVPDDKVWDMFDSDNYYVTDSEGNKYKAGNGLKAGTIIWNLFQVPKDSHGFVFHFLDWPPLDLGK